jgi:murein DD-endopeptidase MepM/ murein hydrolase activator NlpD
MKLRWITALCSLTLFGAVAAFAIVPGPLTQDIAIKTVVEDVNLPLAKSASNEADIFWQTDQIRSDDTLSSLLSRLNVRDDKAINFLRTSIAAQPFSGQFRTRHTITTKTDANGKLLHLEYELSDNEYLVLDPADDSFKVATETLTLEKNQVLKSATITSSLFAATDDANIPDSIAIQLAEIFSDSIDFREDLRNGDHFNVIYETFYNHGELVKTGNVLAAEFVNKGKSYKAVGFANTEGKFTYYTPEGKGLHTSFLRAPLEFTRISSGFTTGRFHPMAAPTGTRIKAASNGVVDFIGVKGGYGNVIVLKHANNISTVYGHMSRFGEGMHRGSKVEQGDVIGYVGMTGLATGPHLHYEFLINGVHRDPLTVALPQNNVIDSRYKAAFEASSKSLSNQISLLGNTNIAALE